MFYSQGECAAARSLYEESLALRRTIGDRAGVTACLSNLGTLAYNEGAWDQAQALHSEALAIAQKEGDSYGQQGALEGLGNVMRITGRLSAARSYFERGLTLAHMMSGKDIISGGSIDLGWLEIDEGNWDQAGKTLRRGLEMARDSALTPLALSALDGLAEQALGCGDAPRSICLTSASEALRASLLLPRMFARRTRFDAHINRLHKLAAGEAFECAWNKGKMLTLDQAFAFALEA